LSAVVSVILAAGAGRRLGGVNKALLRTAEGDTFLAAIARLGTAAGVTSAVVVVAEPHRAETVAEAERLGLPWLDNPDPSRGMASSIELGTAHVATAHAGADAALLWPVDHVAVTPATVRAVVAACSPGRVVIPMFGDRGGHPTGFGRELWPELMRCAGLPEGARSVVRATDPVRLDVDDAGVIRDVDRPVDLPADRRCAP